jgi:hypothetical protein
MEKLRYIAYEDSAIDEGYCDELHTILSDRKYSAGALNSLLSKHNICPSSNDTVNLKKDDPFKILLDSVLENGDNITHQKLRILVKHGFYCPLSVFRSHCRIDTIEAMISMGMTEREIGVLLVRLFESLKAEARILINRTALFQVLDIKS